MRRGARARGPPPPRRRPEGRPPHRRPRARALPPQRLLEFGCLAEVLGHADDDSPIDTPVAPRGYRALSQLPRVNDEIAGAVVARFGALESLLRAPLSELEDVDGLDRTRAREVREALRRLQEHTLADRYLSL